MGSYGRTTIAESKMMFYPTDRVEQYRLFFMLTDVSRVETTTEKLVENIYGKQYFIDKMDNIYVPDIYKNYYRFSYYYPWYYLLEKRNFELLDKIFSDKTKECGHFTTKKSYGKKSFTIVSDLFCGEGEWLSMFNLWNDFITIGNEIEQTRYEKSRERGIDILFNKAYEEIVLPKNTVDIMLFNPPYGQIGGVRNSYYYLKDILEKQYVKTGGHIVLILRKQDMLDCLELMLSVGSVDLLYKFNDDEYEKYQQFACVLTLEYNSKDMALRRLAEKAKFASVIENELDFQHTPIINTLRFFSPRIDITKADFKEYVMSNITYNDKKTSSNFNDILWKNFKKETSAPSVEISKIVMPKKPKYNELSNIIASGYINSDFDERDEVPHVAVGGVKQIVDTMKLEDEYTQKKEVMYKKAVPYLNVLYIKKDDEGFYSRYKYCLKDIQTNE